MMFGPPWERKYTGVLVMLPAREGADVAKFESGLEDEEDGGVERGLLCKGVLLTRPFAQRDMGDAY